MGEREPRIWLSGVEIGCGLASKAVPWKGTISTQMKIMFSKSLLNLNDGSPGFSAKGQVDVGPGLAVEAAAAAVLLSFCPRAPSVSWQRLMQHHLEASRVCAGLGRLACLLS